MADQILNPGFRFYQSANTDAASIKEGFIIRLQEFEIIMEDIRRNPMKGSVQHYLLLGRRGSGKSTLLRRIQIEMDSDKELSKTHIAINLAEEQANIYRLYDLWQEIIQELSHKGVVVTEPEWEEDEQSYSRKLFQAIHLAVEKSRKKIVLLLDNIDRIFENLQEDAALLREYLLNYDDLKIIGGSTKMTEHFWKYNQPFYEFFRVLELKQLTSEEIKKILLYWGKKLGLPQLQEFVERKSGQIETVRILTDGLPRTLQFFVTILLTRSQESGYEYLKLIMDHVTPLYQERLNGLPPAQRKVVLKMAFLWESTGSKELASATYMDSKVVSAQLKQLCDKGIAEKIETKTKNHLYRLAERFFNLWLIFTQGNPQEKRKAKCLTIFLENFYDAEELKTLAYSHLSTLKDGKIAPNKAALLTKAYAQSKYISSSMRDELIRQTLELKGIDIELKEQLPLTTYNIWKKVQDLIKTKEWNAAIKMLDNFEQDDGLRELLLGYIYSDWKKLEDAEKYFLLANTKGNFAASRLLGSLYEYQEKFDLSEKYYLEASEKGDNDSIYSLARLYELLEKFNLAEKYYLKAIKRGDIESLNDIALIYENTKKYKLAEKYYLEAIEKGHIGALNNLGLYYKEAGKRELAEKYLLLSIDKKNVESLNNLANFYVEENKKELAEKYYLQAIEKKDHTAVLGLAHLYESEEKFELAEKYYLQAVEKNNKSALYLVGMFYKNQNKNDLAETYFLQACEMDNADAMFVLATMYEDQKKFDLAEKYYLHAVEKDDSDAMFCLAALYEDQKKFELAETYYLQAIEKDDTDALYSLASLYEDQKKFDLAEKYYLQAIEKGDTDSICWLGFLYMDQEKFDLSEKYFLMAVEKDNNNAYFGLGNIYEIQGKFEVAEKYYLIAKDKGISEALYAISNFYYNNNFKKTEALTYINEYCLLNSENELAANLKIAINLWNGNIKQSNDDFLELAKNKKYEHFETTLMHFLIHGQINFILNFFIDKEYGNDFMELFQPIYYASGLLKDSNENFALKIPPELLETVTQIIASIKRLHEFYYPKTIFT